MTKEAFTKKYDKEIRAIASANNVDLHVGCDMFISNIKNAFNVCFMQADKWVPFDKYIGLSTDYRYNDAAIDYLQVI